VGGAQQQHRFTLVERPLYHAAKAFDSTYKSEMEVSAGANPLISGYLRPISRDSAWADSDR